MSLARNENKDVYGILPRVIDGVVLPKASDVETSWNFVPIFTYLQFFFYISSSLQGLLSSSFFLLVVMTSPFVLSHRASEWSVLISATVETFDPPVRHRDQDGMSLANLRQFRVDPSM